MHLRITREENSADAHDALRESRCSVLTLYISEAGHISDETARAPFDTPPSSWRLITTFQQSTSIGRCLNVTPSIRGMETRRQDSPQSPLSSYPGRQASFRSRDPVGGMPQLHNQVAAGISIGQTIQDY